MSAPRYDLISPAALSGIAKVLGREDDPHAWRTEGAGWVSYVNAAQSYLLAWLAGEDKDPSGLSHIAYAMAELQRLAEAQVRGHGVDDRWAPPPVVPEDPATRQTARDPEWVAQQVEAERLEMGE